MPRRRSRAGRRTARRLVRLLAAQIAALAPDRLEALEKWLSEQPADKGRKDS
jgi:hypothetical protein